MGLTSREKKLLNKEMNPFRDTRLILIFTEGKKTEKIYFDFGIFHNRRVQIKVFESEDNNSAPSHVYNRIKQKLDGIQLETDDQIWLMCDRDRWPDKQLEYVCSHAMRGKTKKAKLAISNPSFELWLYLHFSEWLNGKISSREIENSLRKLLGSYSKNNLDISLYSDKIETAIDNAKKLDINPSHRWPTNPGTRVYKVIEDIKSLMGK